MATNTDDIQLPDFMKSRWQDTPTTTTPTRRQSSKLTRMDKLVLVATTAVITATATFGWAVLMNGMDKLPVLRVHFYVPAAAEDLD